MKITNVFAREIVNSSGYPALECELVLDGELRVVASVPSGTSRGFHEAREMYDGGNRLMGKGLLNAISVIERNIAPLLLHQEPDVFQIDMKMLEMDATKNKEKLGGNVMLAVSSAVLKAQASMEQLEPYELIAHLMGVEEVTLPFPLFNMIHGGVHASNNLFIQEFMIVPAGQHTVRSCVEVGMTLFHLLEQELRKQGKHFYVGMEGGFTVDFESDFEALDLLSGLVQKVNSTYGATCALALDVAASQLYNQEQRIYQWGDNKFSTQDMIELYEGLITHYPIYSIEDGLSEFDWEGWALLNARLGHVAQLVADDLVVTNPERISYGIQRNTFNAVLIKPNQIGTITETLQAVRLCQEHSISTIFSHRSVETEDTLLVDLAVGTNASQLKAGGLLRAERTAKYNQLLRIEDRLTSDLLLR
ncbi:phosphopyruvate hydratase [Candidatus Dependentiae bacterium]|nr:phosphopyruvate hydratase [Candidatus Dependentiae bacterium]